MAENANLGASRPTLPRPARTVPPYHTGKVAIGCAWQPTQRPHHDEDALRLQEALIAPRRRYTLADAAYDLTCATALMALAAVAGFAAGFFSS
jgi:hypothetical protein